MTFELKVAIDNIMKLYLYADVCKMIHYTTEKIHEHKLADDVRDSIMKFADELAEQTFGYSGKPKLSDFSLKHNLIVCTNISQLCQTVLKIVQDLRKEYEKDNMYGVVSIIDDFIGELSQYVYLGQFDNISNDKINEVLTKVITKYIK